MTAFIISIVGTILYMLALFLTMIAGCAIGAVTADKAVADKGIRMAVIAAIFTAILALILLLVRP